MTHDDAEIVLRTTQFCDKYVYTSCRWYTQEDIAINTNGCYNTCRRRQLIAFVDREY